MKNLTGSQIAVAVLILTILFSCSQGTRISVEPVNETGALQTGSFLYALPQTVIDVSVTAEQVTTLPGPYFQYADKYLGIQNVPDKQETTWRIVEMQLNRHVEADPDFIYMAAGIEQPAAEAGINRLVNTGLILDVKDFSLDHSFPGNTPISHDEMLFTDLSVKRNFEAEKDVDVSLVMPGADEETAPLRRNGLKEKTLEQKAEEAANFLIKLKKRRFKLVAGQYDYMPEGEAMADALKELSRLENEYLSLFIGKKIVQPFHRTFSHAPMTDKNIDRVVLFRFGENEGFIDTRESGGLPVMLELSASNKTKTLEQFRVPLKMPVNQLLYRVPDQVRIRLILGEQIWAEAVYPVFQSGAIIPMMLGSE